MSTYQHILCDVAHGLATVTLNRPESMNGMTNRMLRETHDALSAIAADPEVRVVVLTGAGKAFCPGADLNWATSGSGQRDPGDTAEPYHFRVPVLLHEMPAVTIAAVNGACAGAGFGWACGADIRLAARSAMFNTAFLNVAVAGDMGLPWSLPRLVGAAKARELSFFSQKFGAEEAQRIGLVARVWDDDVFRAEVDAFVQELMARSPTALRAMKSHYVSAERMAFRDYVDLETEHHARITASEDTREAFRAFLEKRAPVFKGR
jgi:2-(1,2-epoxy-1,2-dihydrophenyl)acetyl-CoA isomerase